MGSLSTFSHSNTRRKLGAPIWGLKVVILLCLIMETVSDTRSDLLQLANQVSTLQSTMMKLTQELQKEIMENKERITHLELTCGIQDINTTATTTDSYSTATTGITTNSTTMDTSTSNEGSILIVGGETDDFNTLSSVELFGSGDCHELSLPKERAYHLSGLTHDGVILTCGGSDDLDDDLLDCIHFNVKSKTWVPHSTLPEARSGSNMVITKTGTYILGGFGSRSKTSLFLPAGGNTWTTGPEIPGDGVWLSCVVSVNSTNLIIIGGYYDTRQIILWDYTKNTWTEWPDLPYGVSGQACIMTDEGVMVTGGWNTSTDSLTDHTLIINPHTGQVQVGASLVEQRYRHSIFRVKGSVMVFGGRDGNRGYLTSTEQFKGKSWVTAEFTLDTGRDSFSLISIPDTIIDTC